MQRRNVNVNAAFPMQQIELFADLCRENVSLASGVPDSNFMKFKEASANIINFFGLPIDEYECIWNSGATESAEIIINNLIDAGYKIMIHKLNHTLIPSIYRRLYKSDDNSKSYHHFCHIICPISPATGRLYVGKITGEDVLDVTQSVRHWYCDELKSIRNEVIKSKPRILFASVYKFGGLRGIGFMLRKRIIVGDKLEDAKQPLIPGSSLPNTGLSVISPRRGGSIPLPGIIHAGEVIKMWKNPIHYDFMPSWNRLKNLLKRLHCTISFLESCEIDEENLPFLYGDVESQVPHTPTLSFKLPIPSMCAIDFIKLMAEKGFDVGYITNCAAGKTSILRLSWADEESINQIDKAIIETIKVLLEKVISSKSPLFK